MVLKKKPAARACATGAVRSMIVFSNVGVRSPNPAPIDAQAKAHTIGVLAKWKLIEPDAIKPKPVAHKTLTEYRLANNA